MNDADRFRLLGTYRTPRFRYGRQVFCELRGWVTVVGLREAPIPWPVGKLGRADTATDPAPRVFLGASTG